MSVQKKQLSRYYRQIKANLPCTGIMKRQLLARIKDSIDTYLVDHPNATMDEIITQFGAPQEIATACLEEMDPKKISADLKIRKKILFIFFGAVLAVILMIAGTLLLVLQSDYDSKTGYIESSIGTPSFVEE